MRGHLWRGRLTSGDGADSGAMDAEGRVPVVDGEHLLVRAVARDHLLERFLTLITGG